MWKGSIGATHYNAEIENVCSIARFMTHKNDDCENGHKVHEFASSRPNLLEVSVSKAAVMKTDFRTDTIYQFDLPPVFELHGK